MQETLLKAWANRESFEPGTKLKAWLFTILRNEFYTVFRKRRREVEDANGVIAANVGIQPEQDSHMDLNDMQQALGQLPVDQREALLLVSASDMSYEEAAAICGVAASISPSEATLASPTPQPDASAAVSEMKSVVTVTCLMFILSAVFSVAVL